MEPAYAPYEGYQGREDGDEEAHHLLQTFESEDSPVAAVRGWKWLSGPSQPQKQTVKPLFPSIQRLPIVLFSRHVPKTPYQAVVFVALMASWAGILFPWLWISSRPITDSDGTFAVNLDCVDTLWSRRNECGLNGINCQPFSNSSFPFRCPSNCAGVKLLNPRTIGPLEVNYRPLIVGSEFYRGDSFICSSAIHAGIVSNKQGGCGRVSVIGQRTNYSSAERHRLTSIAFDSYFPLTFLVSKDPALKCHGESRGALLFVSMLCTVTLSLFTTSPSLLFFTTFIVGFIHVGLVSDPPQASFHNLSVLPDHMSKLAEGFLPAAFCATILYQTCVKRTLLGLDAQYEKTVLWLGAFWLGALSNYTFDWIPIQRLTTHDIEQQAGAKASLAVILIILALITLQQIYFFWLEGRLLRYLALYGVFLAAIFACLLMPSLQLRIHHYIMALLLLPGTSMQTRPSLLYQGFLLGLFVNGIARWGFASVLQTQDALRGDARFDSVTPVLHTPEISLATIAGAAFNISFTWDSPPMTARMDGISVLVNDVERLRHYFAQGSNSEGEFTWTRPASLNLPEYFRFAFVKDGRTLDYAKVGTWYPDGTWGTTDSMSG